MSRAVMQQALEALEEATIYTSSESWSPSMTKDCEAAITALRAALAEPEQEPISLNNGRLTQYPDGSIGVGTPTPRKPEQPYDQTALDLCKVCGWRTLIPGDACLNCERSKQPEQEPVGHADLGINNIYIFSALEPRVIPVGRTPLYTAPDPRKPLTYEELEPLCEAFDSYDTTQNELVEFARAIERAHGIGEQHE